MWDGTILILKRKLLFDKVDEKKRFYFTHSYFMKLMIQTLLRQLRTMG